MKPKLDFSCSIIYQAVRGQISLAILTILLEKTISEAVSNWILVQLRSSITMRYLNLFSSELLCRCRTGLYFPLQRYHWIIFFAN